MFDHCKKQNLSYFQHMKQAMGYYIRIQKAALYVLIHAFIPCIYKTKASDDIKRLAMHFFRKKNP